MDCQRISGEPRIRGYKKKASTAIAQGDILYLDTSGFVLPADASSGGNAIVGVSMETVLSTDADYAVAREIAVDVAEKGGNGDRFLLEVGTGTPAQTHVGEAHDLTSAGKADLDATTTKVIFVQKIRSATLIEVSFLNTGDPA